jgi:hypothetical protein
MPAPISLLHAVGLKESLRGGGENAGSSATDAVKERHRAIGVCYYPEHWPEEVWEEDARQMADVGIEYVRIGEFMWSVIEPSPGGTFEWGLLDKAIETLASHNLKIVLGTPTACPPKWLVDKHPDILPYGDDGRPRKFGSRRQRPLLQPPSPSFGPHIYPGRMHRLPRRIASLSQEGCSSISHWVQVILRDVSSSRTAHHPF